MLPLRLCQCVSSEAADGIEGRGFVGSDIPNARSAGDDDCAPFMGDGGTFGFFREVRGSPARSPAATTRWRARWPAVLRYSSGTLIRGNSPSGSTPAMISRRVGERPGEIVALGDPVFDRSSSIRRPDSLITAQFGTTRFTSFAPAKSTNSGLLLEPPLDLAWYTREKFVEQSSTVGAEKIRKAWTSPVVSLEAPTRRGLYYSVIRPSRVKYPTARLSLCAALWPVSSLITPA